MDRWLARLAFSFLIFAGLLAIQAYREITAPAPAVKWRIALYAIAVGILAALAIRGINARHRSED